jgi:hypothetical protein
MTSRISKLACGAILALAASPSGAQAGEYHLYSCRMPSGQSAPVDGWSGSLAHGSAYDDYLKNTCGEGGALIAALGAQTKHLADADRATWAFESSAAERLVAGALWRAGDNAGGATPNATYQFWLSGPNAANVFYECIAALECKGVGDLQRPLSAANRVVVPGPNLGSRLFVNAGCGGPSEPEPYECAAGSGDANGYAAAVYLFAADLTLEQSIGPSAGNVSGELASAPAVSGTSDVAFSASDGGSGVYEAVFTVDGQVVQRTVVDENGGRCKDVGQTSDGLPAFLYAQPCLGSVSADVGFDATKVSDGPHHLVVSVIDAAGNAAPVLDRALTVVNPLPPGTPGPANGANASAQATLIASWKSTKRERLTSPYGRAQTIVGRLTGPGGVPIGGAQIDLISTQAGSGAKPMTMTSPRTAADGSFTVRLAGGVSSRTLHFAYRSHIGDVLPVVTRTLALSVRAGIALTVTPRTASVGRSIFFRGRLLGAPMPRGGKQLVLEARSPGSAWIEFKVIRADAHGRCRASYRFRFPGPVDYQFRVRSEAEADYPFAAGSSNVVRVRER